jgi:hypothetical protein
MSLDARGAILAGLMESRLEQAVVQFGTADDGSEMHAPGETKPRLLACFGIHRQRLRAKLQELGTE